MGSVKELRGRIKSVGNIRQITKAMEMVASMKLRKVQARALSNRPYTAEIKALVGRVAEASAALGEPQPLFEKRKRQTIGVLVLTSDRGLCAAFNSNAARCVREFVAEERAQNPDVKFRLYCYGRKGYQHALRRKLEVERHFAEPPIDKADFAAAKFVSDALVADFLAKKVDAVRVVYTQFLTASRFVPVAEQFLPVEQVEKQAPAGNTAGNPAGKAAGKLMAEAGLAEKKGGYRPDYLLEPDPAAIFERLLPRYLETLIYSALVQSLASEHASRRMAMKGATDAATRIGKELKMEYNRARQESITKELLDIVGGASAVS